MIDIVPETIQLDELPSGNSTRTFDVRLLGQPTVPLVVATFPTFAPSGSNHLEVSRGAGLIFTPDNWATAQTVEITTLEEDDARDESIELTSAVAASTVVAMEGANNDLVFWVKPGGPEQDVVVEFVDVLQDPTGDPASYDEAGGKLVFHIEPGTTTANSIIGLLAGTPGVSSLFGAMLLPDDPAGNDGTGIVDLSATGTTTWEAGWATDSILVEISDQNTAGVVLFAISDLVMAGANNDLVFWMESGTASEVDVEFVDTGQGPDNETVVYLPGEQKLVFDIDTSTTTANDIIDLLARDAVPGGMFSAGLLSEDGESNEGTGAIELAATTTIVDAADLGTTEEGGTVRFALALATPPAEDVTIPIHAGNADEGSVSVRNVIFTPLNWDVKQPVSVTGVDDDVDDGDVTYHIVISPAASVSPEYAGLDPADATLANTDDDTAGVEVWPTTGLYTTEDGRSAQFSVVLTSEPVAATLPVIDDTNQGFAATGNWTSVADVDEVQELSASGATGGTFTIRVTLAGELGTPVTADPIPFDANPATIQTAINDALSGAVGYSPLDIAVTGSGTADLNATSFAFSGASVAGRDQPLMSVDGSGLVDGDSAAFSEPGKGRGQDPFLGGHKRHAAGDGTAVASWTETGLEVGIYDVLVNWQAGSDLATNAEYRIYFRQAQFDGTANPTVVRRNQQVSPSDAVADGLSWALLGTFRVEDGQLKVELGSADEVQQLGTSGATGGAFTVTVTLSGESATPVTTDPIGYNADLATIQAAIDTALSGLAGYSAGDIAVSGTGSANLNDVEFTFSGTSVAGKDQPLISVDASALTDGENAAFTELTKGTGPVAADAMRLVRRDVDIPVIVQSAEAVT